MNNEPRWDRMARAINLIIQNPDKWDQGRWHAGNECGTTCCFAGYADYLDPEAELQVGNETWEYEALDRAQNFYNLSQEHSNYLFASNRTFAELYYYVQTKGEKIEDKNIKAYPLLEVSQWT